MMLRNWPTSVWTLVAARGLEAAASSALLPFVVLWAHRYAGLSGIWAGGLFVAQAVGEFGAGVLAGGLFDRMGHRRVLVVSTAGMTLAYGSLVLAREPAAAVPLFLLAGVVESGFHPTTAALVGDIVDDDDLDRAFGLVAVGSNVGQLLGPLLGAAVVLLALPDVFVLSGALLALCVVLELLGLPRRTGTGGEGEDDDPEIPAGTVRALRTDRGLAALVAAGGLLAVTTTWFEADGLVVVRQQTALGTTGWATLFTIAAGVTVLVQLPLTRLTRRLPPRRVLAAGAALQGAGLAVLVGAGGGYGVLVVSVVLLALGGMAYSPTVSSMVTRRARPSQRASYQAALSITEDIGNAIGPASGLAVVRVATAAGLWAAGAALSGLAGVAAGAVRPSHGREADGAAEPARRHLLDEVPVR